MKRFYDRVDSSAGRDACWPWLGCLGTGGYGVFWLRGRNHASHRVMWMLERGEIPAGMFVCHTCDNRRCCNPAHLWIGTSAENTADKVAKNRQARGAQTKPELRARGERQGLAVLTVALVRRIRRSGLTHAALARKLGVAVSNVRNVRTGFTWRHVPGEAKPWPALLARS